MDERSVDARFVRDVLASAGQALDVRATVVQHLDVAGTRVDLVYAGTALHDQFAAALGHLEVSPRAADEPVVIRLWDTRSTGVSAPPPPVPLTRITGRGDILGLEDPRFRTAFHWSEYSLCVLDVDRREGAYWVDDPSNLAYWSRSSPLRTVFGWVLAERGVQLVHAAAIATDDGAVAVVGAGGTGKSTTSLTCLDRGLYFLGDDYVAVSFDPPTVHSLYATAKIADADHPAARGLPALPASPGDEKLVLLLHPDSAGRLRRSSPLRAVVTPEIVDQTGSEVVDVARDRLEHAASFTTSAQIPHTGVEARARIGRLLDEVPTGLLRLGRDRDGVVDAIRRLAAGPAVVSAPDDVVSHPVPTMPSVSVVVPVHDGAHFLASAVDSILRQGYPRLEIIVVDDGSTDDLEAVVRALPVDVRVHRQRQAGPAAARNAGMAIASGEVLAFLDVDDQWPEGALSSLVREWSGGDVDVVMGAAQVVVMDPVSGEQRVDDDPGPVFPHYIGSAVYGRRVFEHVGLFDEDMMFGEDTDWFARLEESDAVLRRLTLTTLVVRRHGQNMTEGRDLVELHVVRAVKKALDRKRVRDGA